jgi:hypothetical protein
VRPFRKQRSTQGWTVSAEQLRAEFQVFIDEIDSLSRRIDDLEADKYAISATYREFLRDIFVFVSVSTETAEDLMLLIGQRAISPPAANAAMQSLGVFQDSIDGFKARVVNGLLGLNVNAKDARWIVEDAWTQAKARRPGGLSLIEERRKGAKEWDWITEDSWK